MTLYEMLDSTLYYQAVLIYVTNIYDQNMPIFQGDVQSARGDIENVWDYLMCKVDFYDCNTGILIIKVRDEYYEDRMESHYLHSEEWGDQKK